MKIQSLIPRNIIKLAIFYCFLEKGEKQVYRQERFAQGSLLHVSLSSHHLPCPRSPTLAANAMLGILIVSWTKQH